MPMANSAVMMAIATLTHLSCVADRIAPSRSAGFSGVASGFSDMGDQTR